MPPKVDVKTLAGNLDNAAKLLYELMEEFETIRDKGGTFVLKDGK